MHIMVPVLRVYCALYLLQGNLFIYLHCVTFFLGLRYGAMRLCNANFLFSTLHTYIVQNDLNVYTLSVLQTTLVKCL